MDDENADYDDYGDEDEDDEEQQQDEEGNGSGSGSGAGTGADDAAQSSQPTPEPPPEEEKGPDFSISGSQRAMLMGFLAGFIERCKLVSLLPGADASGDTSIQMTRINDGYEELKAMMLDNASLVLKRFQRGAKPSKFAIETKWLMDTIAVTLQEVDDESSFMSLAVFVDEGERRERNLPYALNRIKTLSSEIHEIRNTIQLEAENHKTLEREWNKTLSTLKQGVKDLKKENKVQAKYRADILSATADCNRREREVGVKVLRDEVEKFKGYIESEKRVNTRCTEFIKKQNLQLMEEAINLQANLEVDMAQMDILIRRIREQRDEKQKVINELEPRYLEEKEKREADEAELERQRNVTIEQQGLNEMKLRATIRIQRMYRGFKSRVGFKKELKKWRKKNKKDGGKKKK